jgi:HK97 family phage prohead protease
MPYFISESNPDCAGWAVEKEDGEVIGCHMTKQDAIDQMVAVSIAEEMEPGGERVLPDNYRPALAEDVPEGRACGNCYFYDESRQNAEGDKAWCEKWDDFVDGAYYCNAWQVDEHDEERQVSLNLPAYIRSAARKGLEYNAQGLAGDGLVERTVREARLMADGQISEDKVIRSNAWGARHLVDLDASQNSDSNDDGFPGAGAVAFYLWGINPLDPEPAMDWFMSKAEAIKAERADAPAPPKDQITGSEKNPSGSAKAPAGAGTIELTDAIETGLANKAKEHNDNVGDDSAKRATVGMLRTVFRRGAGAYSTSHRPGVTRDQWAYARVNAFLYLLRNGRPSNPAYVGDNDLLPKDHPKSSRSLNDFAERNSDSDDVVIVDIDGTLLVGGQGIQKNVDYVNALYEKFFIYIVTGRGEDEQDKTVAQLAEAGVKYDDIEFNEDLSIPTPEYKGNKAADILSEQTVVLAIDNDPAARRAYFDLGIKTLDPKRIKSGDMPVLREAPAFHRQREQEFGNVSYMTEQVETRRVTVSDFELRANESGDGMSFTGYAAVFNSPSEPLPFIETIAPGAFARSLKARNNIRMYMNHDSSMLLATTRAKTLRLQEDSKGLLASADLPETSVGKDLSILMKRGDVTSMSFGFTVPSGGDRWSEDGMNRELRQIKLFEVSVVTGFPAYSATSAQVRSFDALATRTGVDADRLADAILVLESGQTLSPDQGALLRETVAKLEPTPTAPPASLGLMAKHLELIKNF